ncbi:MULTISPECIES: hypothetical protein [Cupriavidus]
MRTPHSFSRCLAGLLVSLFGVSLPAVADSLAELFETPPSGRFAVSQNSYFLKPERAIRNRIAFEKRNHVTNHFCVVGYEWPDGGLQVWVNWREQNTNILWDGNEDRQLRELGLMATRRNLRLGKDTVETNNDIGGSTYLVTRRWWLGIADDCAAHGEKYVIKPFRLRRR